MRILVMTVLWMAAASVFAATTVESTFLARSFDGPSGELKYRLLLPENFDPAEKYPLVLFLHGAGERGDDNKSQLTLGAELFLAKRQQFPAVVLFPQAPENDYWAVVEADRSSLPFSFSFPYTGSNNVPPTNAMNNVMALTRQMMNKPFIDTDRMYVTGLSMGGMGTLELLARQPDWFSAAIAICPGANPAVSQQYSPELALRIYHGAEDQIVVPELSARVAEKAKNHIAILERKVYLGTDHNSWDKAFAEPDFLSWLMSK
ncbi:prolyl oligopeptidase family serine peptidase [Alteromonas lipotrueiana]|uniref:carboxylesterase family protein n=1 Tax=Alteromonas lipotrueiana TaxID=2803815 RepID=UPI001C493FC3|nr:prolyl oligopeptidase family serine peptidase [Alteromonas lipotrueiana]